MSDTINCPACQEPIMAGAKICKHCKSRIMKCPHCLEPTIEGEAKCVVCESKIAASGRIYKNADRLIFPTKKKNPVLAAVLSLL